MCKGFSPNVEKLSKFSTGSLGIAAKLNNLAMADLINKAPEFKEQIESKMKLIPGMGLDALEKTIISSMLDSMGPITKVSEALLEVFAGVEQIIPKITGGYDPSSDPNSFTSSKNKKDNSKYPTTIFLLKTINGEIEKPNSDDLKNKFYVNDWIYSSNLQDYINKNLKYNEKYLNSLSPDKKESTKNNFILSYTDKFNKLKNKTTYFDIVFLKDKVKFNNKDIIIDIESSYTITITETKNETETILTFIAVKKQTNSINGNGFITPNLLEIPSLIEEKLIDPIQDKLLDAIILCEKVIEKPVEFLLEILTKKLEEHCKFLNLKDDLNNPIRPLIYFNNKCLLDGYSFIKFGNLKLGLGLKDGKISVEEQDKENPFLSTILNFLKLPIEIIIGIIKAIKKMLEDIVLPTKILDTYNNFITFKWLTDLISFEKLMTFLGSTDGTAKTIPFFGGVNLDGSFLIDAIKKLLDMIVEFFNALIGIIEAIFCFKMPQIVI